MGILKVFLHQKLEQRLSLRIRTVFSKMLISKIMLGTFKSLQTGLNEVCSDSNRLGTFNILAQFVVSIVEVIPFEIKFEITVFEIKFEITVFENKFVSRKKF